MKINRALLEDDDDGEAEESIKDTAAEISYKEQIRKQVIISILDSPG